MVSSVWKLSWLISCMFSGYCRLLFSVVSGCVRKVVVRMCWMKWILLKRKKNFCCCVRNWLVIRIICSNCSRNYCNWKLFVNRCRVICNVLSVNWLLVRFVVLCYSRCKLVFGKVVSCWNGCVVMGWRMCCCCGSRFMLKLVGSLLLRWYCVNGLMLLFVMIWLSLMSGCMIGWMFGYWLCLVLIVLMVSVLGVWLSVFVVIMW